MGVGVLTLHGFTLGWGPLIHKYIGNNIINCEVATIHHEVATSVVIVVQALSVSRHHCCRHLRPAVIVVVVIVMQG